MSETDIPTQETTPDNELRAQAMIEASLDEILGTDTSSDASSDTLADKPRVDRGEEELAEAHSAIEESQIKDAEVEKEPPVDDEALTKALGALRRDNVPGDVIDAMLKDNPDKIIEWAGPVLERQSNVDRRMRGDKPEADANDTTEDTKADPTGPPATDESLEELVRPFADEVGSEHATETLTKLATYVREKTLAEVRPHMEYISNTLLNIQIRESRADLRERFPQVEDNDTWDRVLKRGDTLLESGGYGDPGSALEDAARLELGEQSDLDRQVETAKKRAKRSRGTPTAPTRTRKVTPTTPDEMREAILDDILGPE